MTCTFCQLIDNGSAQWVLRGPVTSAFATPHPLAPGHSLVVPTVHYTSLFDVPTDVLSAVTTTVQVVAAAMRTALGADGVNILRASGPGSEQSVLHLHMHVVPRWADDGFSTWPAEHSDHEVGTDPIATLAQILSSRER